MRVLKNICFLITDLEGGGAQRVMCNLANYFLDCGYNVQIICFSNRQQVSLYSLNPAVSLYVLPKQYNHKDKLIPSSVELLVNVFKIICPDVVIPFLMPVTAYAYFAAKECNVKIITSERNDPNKKEDPYWTSMRKEIFYYADGKVFQTENAQKYYDMLPGTVAKIIANPLCINMEYPYVPSIERENRIVCLSKYEPQKNLPLLIDSFEEFIKYHPDYWLEIYGNDFHGIKASIQDLINTRGLSKHVFLYDAKANIFDIIYQAKIGVLTSDYEGMPNALLETIALGIPSIATDCPCGGVKTIIQHMHNGLLAKVGDKSSIVANMKYIAETPRQADIIAQNGMKLREKLNINHIGKEWLDMISLVTGMALKEK